MARSRRLLLFTHKQSRLIPDRQLHTLDAAGFAEEFGKIDKALQDFNFAFKLDAPFNRTAARFRADLYQSLHRYQDAINDYGLLLVDGPTDGLYFSRGNCYLKNQQSCLSSQRLYQGDDSGRQPFSYIRERGDAYLSLKQDGKALADYNAALNLDPEGNISKDGHEHLHRSKAEIYKRMGKTELAKKRSSCCAGGRKCKR